MLSNPDISLGGVGGNLQVIRNIFHCSTVTYECLGNCFYLIFFLHQFFHDLFSTTSTGREITSRSNYSLDQPAMLLFISNKKFNLNQLSGKIVFWTAVSVLCLTVKEKDNVLYKRLQKGIFHLHIGTFTSSFWSFILQM